MAHTRGLHIDESQAVWLTFAAFPREHCRKDLVGRPARAGHKQIRRRPSGAGLAGTGTHGVEVRAGMTST